MGEGEQLVCFSRARVRRALFLRRIPFVAVSLPFPVHSSLVIKPRPYNEQTTYTVRSLGSSRIDPHAINVIVITDNCRIRYYYNGRLDDTITRHCEADCFRFLYTQRRHVVMRYTLRILYYLINTCILIVGGVCLRVLYPIRGRSEIKQRL